MVADEGDRVKVLDFGLAKLFGGDDVSGLGELVTVTQTQEGMIVGTPHYMSPEQARGQEVDQRSDIFSLGVMLFEMLTGTRPFPGTSAIEVLSSIQKDPPPDLSEVKPKLPRHLGRVIGRCMAKAPADRYQTARDVYNELQALREESTTGATRPAGTAEVFPRSVAMPRGPSLRIAAITIAVLALLGTLAGIWLSRQAETESSALDEDLVAVLPFRVNTPPELTYLGGGFMDLLAARLDGEAGPRAVDPGVVVPAASGDNAGGTSVARSLGAGFALTGSVVGDVAKIVANADLTRVSDGTVTASASAEGPADSFSELADQLVIQLLSLGAGEYTTSIASVTSTSSGALKAYLLGKQAFRDGRYYESVAQLDEALAIDPTFALAAIARADHSTNTMTIGEAGHLELAWEHRERLSARDLEYLEVRLPQTPRTGAEAVEAYERLTRAQPDRVEAWYWLFEMVFHRNGIARDEEWFRRVRAVGDKTLELDPGYLPVYAHYMFVEPRYGTPERMRDTYQKLTGRSGPESTFGGELFTKLAAGGDQLVMNPAALADNGTNALFFAPFWPLLMPEVTPPGYIAYVDAALSEMRRRAGADFPLQTVAALEYANNVGLGRRERAAEVREQGMRDGSWTWPQRGIIYDAVWHGVAPDAAAVVVRELDERLREVSADTFSIEDARDLTAVGVWRYKSDPAYVDDAAAPRLRAAIERAERVEALRLEAHALLFDAWCQARGGDETEAAASLARLLEIVEQDPRGDVVRSPFVFAIATIYEELGDLASALEALRRTQTGVTSGRHYARRWHESARLAAQLGETARAIEGYERWLKLREAAEPSLQSEVDAVRTELAHLRGDE